MGDPQNRRKTVLHIGRTLRIGGAERLIRDLLPGIRSEFDAGFTVFPPGNLPEGEELPVGWMDSRECLKGHFDIVHSHLFLPGFFTRLRRTFDSSFRWVHTIHYHSYDGLSLPGLRAWLDRKWIFPGADGLVAIGDTVAGSLPGFPNLRIIENAIRMDPALSSQRMKDTVLANPILGCMAMLRREKSVADLIRAVGLLRERFPGVRLLVAGDGPEFKPLEELVRSLGLEGQVTLLGFVKNPEDFYAAIDLYVQPSIAEPFGLAAVEAFRFGLPLVCPDTGNLPTIAGQGRFGGLVDRGGPDFPSDLCQALASTLDRLEEFREKAKDGRLYWEGRLSPERMTRDHLALYKAVLRPRILMVSPRITDGGGGLQRQVLLQSRAMAARGHGVAVLQRTDMGYRPDTPSSSEWTHARVLQTPDWFSRVGVGGMGERLRGLTFLVAGLIRMILFQGRFDIIHAHQLYSPTFLGAVGKVLLGKPLVVRVTASGELGESRELARLPFVNLRRWAFGKVDRVIALTPKMADEIRTLGFSADQIRIIPNAVEVPENPVPQPRTESGPFRILYTGRLSSEKRLDTIMEAAELVGRRNHSVEIHFVGGPGGDRDVTGDLQEHARRLPPNIATFFHGHQPDPLPFYRDSDVFVLPSVSEGMSNALLEAMAHGMVCLASDIHENRAVVVDGRSGILFPVGDGGAVADALERLILDRLQGGAQARTLGAGARARIKDEFSVDAVVTKVQRLYLEILPGWDPSDEAHQRSA